MDIYPHTWTFIFSKNDMGIDAKALLSAGTPILKNDSKAGKWCTHIQQYNFFIQIKIYKMLADAQSQNAQQFVLKTHNSHQVCALWSLYPLYGQVYRVSLY